MMLRKWSKTHAFEYQVQFLFEKRTKPYLIYGEGASQEKIVHGAKSALAQVKFSLDWPKARCGWLSVCGWCGLRVIRGLRRLCEIQLGRSA
jgi:hypothetical protein